MSFEEVKPKTEKEWLRLRTEVLTATDVSVILGLNRWKSVAEMQQSKLNSDPIDNSYIWLGQTLEPVVVSAVNKLYNKDFKLFDSDGSRSFLVDRKLRLGATPDAGDGKQALECKTTKRVNVYQMGYFPPSYYLVQLYVQLMALDYKSGILAIMSTDMSQKNEVLSLPLFLTEVRRDPIMDLIILAEVSRYWDCMAINKQYRVNRKNVNYVELKLRCLTKSILSKA